MAYASRSIMPDRLQDARATVPGSSCKLDGVLDEAVYTRELPFGGLIQVAPDYGAPQTERSDISITYDDRNIYLTCRC